MCTGAFFYRSLNVFVCLVLLISSHTELESHLCIHLYLISNPNNYNTMEAPFQSQHLERNIFWLRCVTIWCTKIIRPGFNSN